MKQQEGAGWPEDVLERLTQKGTGNKIGRDRQSLKKEKQLKSWFHK